MKQNKLTITLNCSAREAFDFVLDPNNTPKWIHSLVYEEVSESSARLGTVYRNKNQAGNWGTYTITAFDRPKTFTMTAEDGNYHVRYTLISNDDQTCELEYFEWVDRGELPDPFQIKILEELKKALERV